MCTEGDGMREGIRQTVVTSWAPADKEALCTRDQYLSRHRHIRACKGRWDLSVEQFRHRLDPEEILGRRTYHLQHAQQRNLQKSILLFIMHI